jgi:hypothetical protein
MLLSGKDTSTSFAILLIFFVARNTRIGDRMSKIINVIPEENYRLLVELDNGSTIILNLETRLTTMRFALLADPVFFHQVTWDEDFLRWGDKLDISLTEIFQLART